MKPDFSKISDASRKYDFVLLTDIADGNQNGDPDWDNRPRTDEETGQGLMSDVCLKRKIRDYIDAHHAGEPRNSIYVLNRGMFLEEVNTNLVEACKRDAAFLNRYKAERGRDALDKKGSPTPEAMAAYACDCYFDWRCFGAVPGKPVENSTVRGPVQLQFGRSVDPVFVQEHSIGRVVQNRPGKRGAARRNQEDAEPEQGLEVHGTFGSKYTIRYGLFRFNGHYSPFLARKTGFNDSDLSLFWEALTGWPETDYSAARAMAVRGLYVFQHQSELGNAPAQELLELVRIDPLGSSEARSWDDYVSRLRLPAEGEVQPGVTFHRVIG